MKSKMLIGNWKMNKNQIEIKKFSKTFLKLIENKPLKKIIFGFAISSINLLFTKELFKSNKNIIISAQDAFYKENGAFTGCDSWSQIKSAGIKCSIIGHSERRSMFNDTDEIINKKIISLTNNGMKAILCVGESLEERENNSFVKKIKYQISEALKNISFDAIKNLIIAYEPIWAIGTGKSASSNDAEEICKLIRDEIRKMYNEKIANDIYILYGGSVNLSNIKEYLNMPNIDGGLVGGASLIPTDFYKMGEII